MILAQTIGDYSQTIWVGDGDNRVLVKINGETLYEGVAEHINDLGDTLSFKDDKGKQHDYQKYTTVTTI